MAVIVTVGSYSNGKPIEEPHESGVMFMVREQGHLFIQKDASAGATETVAIYAPGSWHSVRLAEAE